LQKGDGGLSPLRARDNWDSHWQKYAPSAEINPAQIYRRKLVLEELKCCKVDRFLDIGSGQGDLCLAVQELFPRAEILGVELSEVGVAVARQKVPHGQFIQRDLSKTEELPSGWKHRATAAVCSEVLEHVDDPVAFLAHAAEFLAPGARVVVTVPAGPRSAFDRHIGHRRHFTPALLDHTAGAAGFQVEKIQASGFPFFNLYKLVVILRGKKLIEDVANGPQAKASFFSRLVMGIFRFF
jgi:2-polyprenyl-3-methyl-5-hydroxy-6-metoxy-1,4-benzoquinol methylase